jgi:D-alanyl-D-alanine carboxypeptidase (penicillin-binding protein 5/6)
MRRALSALCLFIVTLVAIPAHAAALPTTPPPPPIEARSYILMDYSSGKVLAGDKAEERMEPASLTKIMTVYIVLHELKAGKIQLTDEVRISEKAWRMEGSRTFIEVGKTVPLEVLLKGLVVQSGNDATVALAEHSAGSEEVFVTLMNQTAATLGMKSTHFANSTGLPDPNHYTTAHDLARLTQALIRDYPEHYSWYSIKEFTWNNITQPNRNLLLWRDPTVDGVKTGHTESAGFCLVSSAKQDGMRLIAVVLGAKSENARAVESQKLLSYGFRFFETHRLYAPGKALTNVRVWKGEQEQLPLGLTKEIYITIPRGQYSNLKAAMKITPRIMAPVNKGARYGTVELSISGEKLLEQPLVALQTIPEGGFFSRLIDEVKLLLE